MTIELYDVDAYIQLFDPNLIRLQTVLQCDVKSLSCYWKSLRESGTGPDIPRHNSHLYLQTCFFFSKTKKKFSPFLLFQFIFIESSRVLLPPLVTKASRVYSSSFMLLEWSVSLPRTIHIHFLLDRLDWLSSDL